MGTFVLQKQSELLSNTQKLTEQIVVAETEQDLMAACSAVADSLEVAYFSHGMMWSDDCHHPNFKIISNYNSEWLDEYDSQDYYLVDPRARACMSSLTPVYWSTERPYLETLEQDEKEMMENAHEHKVCSGISVPVFSFQDTKGAFSFGLSSDSGASKQKKHLELIAPFVNYLGAFVHQSMIKILKLEKSNNNVSLSEREKDCLSWAADGKTAREIASLLYLSDSTVKYHLRHAMEKLRAKNTSQALSIAILKGYIHPKLSNE